MCGDGIGVTRDNVRYDGCVRNMTWNETVGDANGGGDGGGGWKL